MGLEELPRGLMSRTWDLILRVAPREFIDSTIIESAVSPRYTGVLTSNGLLGIAYSHTREEWCQPDLVEGSRVGDVLDSLLTSTCTPSRAIGQALVNAWGQAELASHIGNSISWDDLMGEIVSSGGLAVFVGEIKNVPEILENNGIETIIIERNPRKDNTLQDYYATSIIPRATILFITGSAFARPDIDLLLESARRARTVVFIGPSASIPPSALKAVVEELGLRGRIYEATRIILDKKKVFSLIRNNQGHRAFSKYSRNITIRIK